jgi:hypothetical protein
VVVVLVVLAMVQELQEMIAYLVSLLRPAVVVEVVMLPKPVEMEGLAVELVKAVLLVEPETLHQ